MRRWLLALLLLAPVAAQAEAPAVRIGIQPGMSYLALYVMQREQLVEKRATAAGQPLQVRWVVSANGTVITDGVLSGGIDVAGTGIPAFVTLWAKGRGSVDIRGLASYGSIPGVLVTRNPAIHSVADFTAADRIAVPAVRASIQAILLEMMAAKVFGPDQWGRLDPLTVSLSHPDAMIAILSGRSEVDAHFTTSPFYQIELRQPGVHAVLTKEDIFPGPLSNGILWTTARFHAERADAVRAVRGGLDDAMALIHADPMRAAQDYLALSKEKLDAPEVAAIIRELDARFETVPHGVAAVAAFMHQVGLVKLAPARWQDMFFAEGWADGGS